ncbi:MAG TPA: CoA transferase [Bacillota bacterium]|nr:CoA transferase [Bacillota bacterium]
MPNPPLSGIRVLELGQLIAAPVATRILADFGADVVKVEPPGSGDPLRSWGRGDQLWWRYQSRGKRLVTADLRQEAGRDLVRRLIAHCDVLVENFRTGRLADWGLGDDELRVLRPDLVIAHISGYGQTGPYRDRPGFGNIAESMGGLRYITGEPDGPPMRVGISLGDEVAALHAVIGVLLGLRARPETVDVALTESVFSLLENTLAEWRHLGVVRERTGNVLLNAAPSGVYEAADHRWLAIGGNGDSIFRRLCHAIGRTDLAEDPSLADNRGRMARVDELNQVLAGWVGAHTVDEAMAVLEAAEVPAGPVSSIADIDSDPQLRARDMIMAVEGYAMPGIVPRLAEHPGHVGWAGGEVGAHNAEIYGQLLGLGRDELAALAAKGVI